MKRLLPFLSSSLLTTTLLAQTATPYDSGDAASGAAAGLTALGCGLVPCIIGLAISIGLAVFVYKDATKRGMDNVVLLTIVTVITGPLGLVIYLLMRPKGNPPPTV
ncbi:MAG: hypothetical protein H0X73_04895 [Chthoniobacterales bacterium]|nr:hypothetical protein [Chthoniobacterales bacterium]